MLIGSWAFMGQARETVKEKGKAKVRINRDTSLSKEVIFKAGLKLCETKFSGGYIHLAHLLTNKNEMKKTKELSWSENQGAGVPGAADRRKDQKHGNMALTRTQRPTQLPGGRRSLGMMRRGETPGKSLSQKTLTK